MLSKDQAICIRAVDYSETSQVVTLLTRENGKIGAMAKGSRRPKSAFEGAIEVFSYGQVMFVGSESGDTLAMLSEFVQMPRFRLLRSTLSALHAGLFAVELTEAFCQPYDPHPALFDAMADLLDKLQQSGQPQATLYALINYQRTLLDETGIAPLLDRCTNCGLTLAADWPALYFSSAAGGLLCPGCEQNFTEKRRLSYACAALLAQQQPPQSSPHALLTEAEQLLLHHFTELMHRRPKMAKFFTAR